MSNRNVVNYAQVPISALNEESKNILNRQLIDEKLIESSVSKDFPTGLSRDYRGLLDLMGVNRTICQPKRGENWISDLFQLWSERKPVESNVSTFLEYLLRIDRYDVYDDTIELIKLDCMSYVPVPRYDVMLLYDYKSSSDCTLAEHMSATIKINQPGYTVCDMSNCNNIRNNYEMLHYRNHYARIIRQCGNVVVLISTTIQENDMFIRLAACCRDILCNSGIPNKPKIIPVLLGDLSAEDFPDSPPIASIMSYHPLNYYLLRQSSDTLDRFWGQLIMTINTNQLSSVGIPPPIVLPTEHGRQRATRPNQPVFGALVLPNNTPHRFGRRLGRLLSVFN